MYSNTYRSSGFTDPDTYRIVTGTVYRTEVWRWSVTCSFERRFTKESPITHLFSRMADNGSEPCSPMSADTDKPYSQVDGVTVSRKRTAVEAEQMKRKEEAHQYVIRLPLTAELPEVKKYMPHQLSGAIFCGHLVTDMDSIAGSISAAELYGGVPARASEVNAETRFCLQRWGVEAPTPIEDMLVKYPDAGVCLVDHQQTSQLNPAIKVGDILLVALLVSLIITFLYFNR
jgi:hypothetical protein